MILKALTVFLAATYGFLSGFLSGKETYGPQSPLDICIDLETAGVIKTEDVFACENVVGMVRGINSCEQHSVNKTDLETCVANCYRDLTGRLDLCDNSVYESLEKMLPPEYQNTISIEQAKHICKCKERFGINPSTCMKEEQLKIRNRNLPNTNL